MTIKTDLSKKEIKETLKEVTDTKNEKILLKSIMIILFFLGALITFLSVLLEDLAIGTSLKSINQYSLNLGTELLGSVALFSIISARKGLISKNIIRHGLFSVLLLISIIIPVYFSFNHEIYTYDKTLTSIRDVSINLGTEIIGTLIIYFLLETTLENLNKRENKIKKLAKILDK